jgi:antirestriction protein
MTETKTQTNLVAWNGETYTGAGDWYDKFKNDKEFTEYTEDLNDDELLRLSMYAYNGGYGLVSEDMPLFIAEEQENYRGEAESAAEFTREIIEEMGYISEDMPSWIVIDYEATWQSALRFDFFEYRVIDIDGNYRHFFWWNS